MGIKNAVVAFEAKHRIVPKVMGAATALSVGAITVSAEEGATTVDISSVTESITSQLTDLVSKVAVACAGVVGVGLTIFGLKFALNKIVSFFKAIAK